MSGTNYDAPDTASSHFSFQLQLMSTLFIYSRLRFISWRGRSEDVYPGDSLPERIAENTARGRSWTSPKVSLACRMDLQALACLCHVLCEARLSNGGKRILSCPESRGLMILLTKRCGVKVGSASPSPRHCSILSVTATLRPPTSLSSTIFSFYKHLSCERTFYHLASPHAHRHATGLPPAF